MSGRNGKPINIQDSWIFQSLKERRRLNVLLLTGKAFNGVLIKRFDRYAVVLDAGDQEVLVYKHAIAFLSDVDGAPARDSTRPQSSYRRPPAGGPRRASTQWAR